MDLSFNGKMEAYYQKFIELQEKLRKSEEERLKLEMKFNEMLQTSREEEQAHYRKLRNQYKRFLEEDRKRQERNERIVQTLERIEARVNMLTSRTDRFKMLKRQYQSYLQRISHMKPLDKTEYPPRIVEDIPSEQQIQDIQEHRTNIPDHSSLKKAMGKSNEEKIEILDKYLQSLATQKCRDSVENEEKEPQSDLSQLKYLDNINKKMEDTFNSNRANSIAEDIMNSIYSRHYKKDLFNDETKKVNKLTATRYLNNDIALKQKGSDVGDCYTTRSDLQNLDNSSTIRKDLTVDEFRKKHEDGVTRNESEFDSSYNNNYSIRDKVPNTLHMSDKQVDNKKIDTDETRKRILENRTNTLSKNNHIEVDPLVKSRDHRTKNEQYVTEDCAKNASEYVKSNQNQRQAQPLLLDYRTEGSTDNGYLKTNPVQIQVDPSMEYKNKADRLVKNVATNDFEHLKPVQRVHFENLNDMSYSPSKTEIDIIENEKQIVDSYAAPSQERNNNINKLSNDIYEEQVEAIQREIEHSKHEQIQEHYDTEFADNEKTNRDEDLAEQFDNTISLSETQEELNNMKKENVTSSLINNEREEIETVIPDEQFAENEGNYDNEHSINQLHNMQNIPKYETGSDVQNNEGIHDENKVLNQDNQYQEPIQYDQFENQIVYDENCQVVRPQYDENEQPYSQSESYERAEQQHFDENRVDAQYDENGQLIHSYDQQYDANGQPILYDQQYDSSGQPVQQLYDEKGQVLQQYDESGQLIHSYDQNSHPVQYDENGDLIPQCDENRQLIQQNDSSGQPLQSGQPVQQLYDENGQVLQQYDESGQVIHPYDQNSHPVQYDENGGLIPQYDESGQPLHLYDQSDQPIECQQNQEYGENVQLTEQYNQNTQPVQYEQSFQQNENEQPVEQYNQEDQLVQEYEQSYQQYDANGQLMQQYDENGQPIYQYDENVQPLQQYDGNGQLIQQYDENGQPIHHYDESGVHQYNDNDEPPVEYDEQSQSIHQSGENVELSQDLPVLGACDEVEKLPESTTHGQSNENLDKEKSNADSSKSTVKEDIINSAVVLENSESQPVKQKNVLDMLDTDTESVKQSTSKISNDSDFDFSNG